LILEKGNEEENLVKDIEVEEGLDDQVNRLIVSAPNVGLDCLDNLDFRVLRQNVPIAGQL